VIAYMRDNWAEWVRTEPAWFTPNFISSVGDEFIPDANLRQLKALELENGKNRPRRRSSVGASVRKFIQN